MSRHTRKRHKSGTCLGKKKMTREDAEFAARWWREVKFARMSAYRCRFCHLPDGAHAWHIGNR